MQNLRTLTSPWWTIPLIAVGVLVGFTTTPDGNVAIAVFGTSGTLFAIASGFTALAGGRVEDRIDFIEKKLAGDRHQFNLDDLTDRARDLLRLVEHVLRAVAYSLAASILGGAALLIDIQWEWDTRNVDLGRHYFTPAAIGALVAAAWALMLFSVEAMRIKTARATLEALRVLNKPEDKPNGGGGGETTTPSDRCACP